MKKLFLAALPLPAILLLLYPAPAAARTGYTRAVDPAGRRERHMVREPDLPISETVTAPGFWRPRTRAGYRWVEAFRDEAGRWHGGYWEPLGIETLKEEFVTPGYWAPRRRHGHIWIRFSDRPGSYRAGSWKPMNTFQLQVAPRVWVPGYWNRRSWVPGYWRVPSKEGYRWVSGYFREDGRWQPARWEKIPEEG